MDWLAGLLLRRCYLVRKGSVIGTGAVVAKGILLYFLSGDNTAVIIKSILQNN